MPKKTSTKSAKSSKTAAKPKVETFPSQQKRRKRETRGREGRAPYGLHHSAVGPGHTRGGTTYYRLRAAGLLRTVRDALTQRAIATARSFPWEITAADRRTWSSRAQYPTR